MQSRSADWSKNNTSSSGDGPPFSHALTSIGLDNPTATRGSVLTASAAELKMNVSGDTIHLSSARGIPLIREENGKLWKFFSAVYRRSETSYFPEDNLPEFVAASALS